MLASFLKRDLRNLFRKDASPNFQAQNGLLSLRSRWRSVRSLEKSAHLPGYAYAGGQQLNTIFEVGDGGDARTVAIKGIRNQRDAMLELHSDGQVAIHVDAADAMGGTHDYTRYLTTRNDQDLSQAGGP